jgi:hypothetical protein
VGTDISYLLSPGGTFYMMEGHPFLSILGANLNSEGAASCSYFGPEGPIFYSEESPDYADTSYVPRNKEYEWNWTISDILNALTENGLCLEFFHEYDSLFFNGLPGLEQDLNGFWRPKDKSKRLPLTMTLMARRRSSA